MISQVAAGRRNAISLEVDGSAGALAWSSERNEELWLGHRDRPNELLWRDPSLLRGPRTGAPLGAACARAGGSITNLAPPPGAERADASPPWARATAATISRGPDGPRGELRRRGGGC